jgi:hypothetical protein
MNRDVNSIIKEIDCVDFFNKINSYYFRIDFNVKTWDDVVLKIFPKIGIFDSAFFENKKLTSLNGCPQEINSGFYCSNNKLTSLKGGPQKVGGSFVCINNKLTSLEGSPKEVGYHFTCSFNKLTSLKGAPEKIDGEFFCIGNTDLSGYKIAAYKAYLRLSYKEKVLLTKDNHYYPTEEWESMFK